MTSLSERAFALLHVSASLDFAGAKGRLELDEYVPLRWRAYREPLGAGYLRLGNYSTRLAELAVAPRPQVLHGVTIVAIDRMTPWPQFVVCDVTDKLPIVSTGFRGGEIVDLVDEFQVATRPGEILLFWGDLNGCTGYRCDGVYFLSAGDVLCGVWFKDLTDEEIKLFESHIHPGQLVSK
jgi:hypothetical protein